MEIHMPTMANITVKKNDGTTDQVYTGVQPSGGDKSPAVWRNASVGTAIGHKPTFQVSARSNGGNTARRVEGSFVWPYTVTGADGKIVVSDRAIISFSAIMPTGMLTTDINEAASQGCNLIASSLVKSSLQEGFAPA
jgi:hypothetical protein